MGIANTVEGARRAFDNLNERERRLVSVLGIALCVFVVGLPLALSSMAISDLADENRELSDVLRDVQRARGLLTQRQAERIATERIYDQVAPSLGSFLEEQAREVGLTVRELNDQPDKVVAAFRRRHTRVTLPGVGLRAVVDLMAAVETSGYPVAIEQLQVEHFQTGDRYNVRLGVITFERSAPPSTATAGEAGGAGAGTPRSGAAGVAGPPSP